MNISKKIQDAMKKRHENKDAGFTLIELIVVILIVAILAAVAILALISSLDSAKKSSATTTLKNGQIAITGVQANDGTTDYSTITQTKLNDSENDIEFTVNANPTVAAGADNVVYMTAATGFTNSITLKSVSEKKCFAMTISTVAATTYGSGNTCALAVTALASTTTNKTQKTGWSL